MNKIIEIKNLSKKYYDKLHETLAIDNITLDVYQGEFLTIVGPSGCGKSTFLNILGGIDDKTSGDIIIDKDIRIGYMLQNDCLFSWLTILDNALLGLKINGMLDQENINYVKELLNVYGLGEFMNSYPASLSGGMRQNRFRRLIIKLD